MLGVFVNTGTVILGSLVGLLLKKGIPTKVTDTIMHALGLITLYIGIDGVLAGSNTIVLILSMIIGSIIGSLIDIDDKINRIGLFFEQRLKKEGEKTSIAEGFMTASLLFCIGAMTIVGCLNAGLSGDYELLFTKSTLDLISSCVLASTLGVGVLLAGAFVFVFQGLLVLLSGLLQGVLTDTTLVAEITCAGSVMIMGLGTNLLGITKIKVANMLPAIVVVPFIYHAANLIL